MFRASAIDKLLDKATDHCQLDPNYSTILQICDTIRQGDCQPKQALAAITKKITHDNPHVANFGLLVLESVVKNCGSPIHNEVGTIHFMEQLRELHKASPHEIVKTKILELLQAWAFAFRNTPKYRAVQDIVTIMKAEGHTFPPLKESDAMFKAETAPEWAEGTVCFKCRQVFSMVTRKHHCRACGQVFCGTCSSKTSLVPKFGIEKEVRVCDQCYQQINSRAAPSATTKVESELPAEYLNSSLAHQSQAAPRRTEDELREEEELQLAIALSQSEAEEKEKLKTKSPHLSSLSSHLSAVKSEPVLHAEQDPEMARYLDRSYWDQKNKEETSKVPSAPSHVNSSPSPQPASSAQSNHQLSNTSAKSNTSATLVSNPTQVDVSLKLQQNGVTEDIEIDDFVSTLRGQVEIFVNRMKSNSSRGRSIANDSSVQTLFMNITAMHSRLLRYIQQQDDSRVHYEGLQDKLAQVKDARAALDALRFEHREKLRQQAEEAEKLRQIQMAQKLDIMRQKKQEYLQYQRQLALQRIQEQEREMQMRQEQQKQQYLMGGVPYNRFMPPGPGGMPPGGVLPGGLPSGLPPYSTGPMYSQQAHPSYLGHQVPFAGHIPQGMMHGSHMGSNQMPSAGAGGPQHGQMSHGGPQPGQLGHGGQQPGQMIGPQHNQMGPGVQHGQMGPGGPHPGQMGPGGPHPGQMGPGGQQPGQMGPGGPQPGQMGPGGPQPGQMGPGGPQPGQMGPGGPQPGQMGPGGPQPGQMGPGGPQPGQMGPGGPQPGQMGPGGPQPGQMGPGGPQPGQMGPGGPQPGQMGPGGPQPGQMGPGGPQTGHMASGRPMVGPQMGQLGPTAPQHAQMVPMGMPQTGQMSGPHMGGMGHVQMQQGHNPEVKRESEELISFD